LLVAFACDEHDVAGIRVTQRCAYGVFAVRLHDGVFTRALADVRDDARGILVARVIARNDDPVGKARGDAAHERALARVAVTAAAEHADQASAVRRPRTPARRLAQRLAQRNQYFFERVRRMRVIDHG
jgi:riboflavin biosynthesis pyrimidine reductase